MQVADFDYELPERLIAQQPPAVRGASRLLRVDRESLTDASFPDLEHLLAPGDLLVLNDTRVIPARLLGRKDTGGRIEVMVERVLDRGRLRAQLRASKTPRIGAVIGFGDRMSLAVADRAGGFFDLEVGGGGDVSSLLAAHGTVPLPPYIRRAPAAADRERYQTVYARRDGAVAAPTAGLHFDRDLLARIAARGVESTWVTLHVGAGTFQPLRCERVEDHAMHAEWVDVGAQSCARIVAARARGGRVVAVGTTAVRALESACADGEPRPFCGDTRLFIHPGYQFRCVDAMVTNFHLPRSTLLMLVCAFAGRERVLAAYRHAVAAAYRFFSYGDAMWLTREAGA